MNNINRILVGLDLTSTDEHIIRYAAYFARLLKAEDLYFFHVVRSFELSDEIIEKYPFVKSPVDESLENKIHDLLDQHFDSTIQCNKHIEIKEGNPAHKIIKWSKIKEIDLIFMGSKFSNHGSGALPCKIVTIIPASILLVPENTPESVSNILVSLDFSETSKLALEAAIEIAEKTGGRVTCHHCYGVPHGYSTVGKSFEEFSSIMKENAQKKFKDFISDIKTNIEITEIYSLDEDHNPAKLIYNLAEAISADLVIIGSKGRTGLASLILGSVAEKLMRYDKNIPLLVVKKKDEILDFFDAIHQL